MVLVCWAPEVFTDRQRFSQAMREWAQAVSDTAPTSQGFHPHIYLTLEEVDLLADPLAPTLREESILLCGQDWREHLAPGVPAEAEVEFYRRWQEMMDLGCRLMVEPPSVTLAEAKSFLRGALYLTLCALAAVGQPTPRGEALTRLAEIFPEVEAESVERTLTLLQEPDLGGKRQLRAVAQTTLRFLHRLQRALHRRLTAQRQ